MAHISRRYFMFGALLTGALPRPSIASLKALGYQSPNEKLNVAGIGAGGQPLSDMRQCQGENIVALADVDWRLRIPRSVLHQKVAQSEDRNAQPRFAGAIQRAPTSYSTKKSLSKAAEISFDS